jgi:hypothetical protein
MWKFSRDDLKLTRAVRLRHQEATPETTIETSIATGIQRDVEPDDVLSIFRPNAEELASIVSAGRNDFPVERKLGRKQNDGMRLLNDLAVLDRMILHLPRPFADRRWRRRGWNYRWRCRRVRSTRRRLVGRIPIAGPIGKNCLAVLGTPIHRGARGGRRRYRTDPD